MEYIAELLAVSQDYGEKDILTNLTLGFRKSQVTALLGKSGSGKSTMLQLLNGMIQPTKGVVKVFGEAINYQKTNELRLKVGYVVQQVGLFPHLSIADNIGLLGKITHQPKVSIKERTTFLMEMVQLPATYLKKYPHELSGGEQQRAGLCRALLLKPPLLLMDEPFASLDYATKSAIYGYLLQLQKVEPCSVVIVTHQLEEAETLADAYVWLDSGAVKSQGSKENLYSIRTDYQTPI